MDLVGQSVSSKVGANPPEPQTSVLGHMLIVAVLAYYFTETGACGKSKIIIILPAVSDSGSADRGYRLPGKALGSGTGCHHQRNPKKSSSRKICPFCHRMA
jgi:hypothetical protein